MQLTVIWPDSSKTFEHIDRMRGLTRRDQSGTIMRPAFIIADQRPVPNVEQSAHLFERLRRQLALVGALVPIGSPLAGHSSADVALEREQMRVGQLLRDQFAAGAIAATYGASRNSPEPKEAARRAFDIADAMLAERERRGHV